VLRRADASPELATSRLSATPWGGVASAWRVRLPNLQARHFGRHLRGPGYHG
jgi:hypothetical protein